MGVESVQHQILYSTELKTLSKVYADMIAKTFVISLRLTFKKLWPNVTNFPAVYEECNNTVPKYCMM